MITLFNRAQLTVTFSVEEQSRLRSLLHQNGIPFHLKVVNRNSPSAFSDTRARTGTLGQNLAMSYEYIFYVRHRDYEKAAGLCGVERIR